HSERRRWRSAHLFSASGGQSMTFAPPVSALPNESSYLTSTRTLVSWLTTTDHKRIGVMYLVTILPMLAVGGLFAMLLRIEHLSPGPTIMDALTYNRLFTLHGVTMVWLFMIPSIPAAFGNFLLPIMLGTKDVAFPRLNLASYYIYLLGALVVLGAMLGGGVD